MHGIRIQLPSRGHYGMSSINMRRPKLSDLIEYFQSGNNSIVSKNALIQSLCEEDISKLPVGDREFLFTNIRSLVNSNTLSGTVPCTTEGCGDSVVYILDLSSCKVSQLPEDFISNYALKFPICGITKVVNVLTVEKESLLEDYIRFYESSDVPLQHSDLGDNLYDFAKYACMLGDSVSIGSVDKNIGFLRDLDWSDFEKLMLYDVLFECGPEVVAEAQCSSCKQRYRVRIKTDSSFFGLSLEGLISRHRFLAKASNIGFTDFLNYTVPLLNTVTEGEVQRVREHNSKVKATKRSRR